MYHDVISGDPDASGFAGPGPARFKLAWVAFMSHLDEIARVVGAPPAVADDLVAAPNSSRSWSLTFDDGGISSLHVGEELARRQWRGHFFIVTGLIGRPGFLDASAIRELRRMGHVIGSHSSSHPARMSYLSETQLLDEWQSSVAALSDLLGEQVRTASVPGGFYAKPVAIAAAEAGIVTLFTSEPVRAPRRLGGCLVIGRLSVRTDSSRGDVSRAAAGVSAPWLRQYAGWNLRKPLKMILGARYEETRARYQNLHRWARGTRRFSGS